MIVYPGALGSAPLIAQLITITPLKTNMEPENNPLEKEKHLQTTNFWVLCLF